MAAMVLEQAVLEVLPGLEPAFEGAFATAKEIISSAAGFRSLRLGRCLEEPDRYVLLEEWERPELPDRGLR